MSKIAITSPELTPPVGPFSEAIKVDGFIYFSGHIGQDPATGKLVHAREIHTSAHDIIETFTGRLENRREILEDALCLGRNAPLAMINTSTWGGRSHTRAATASFRPGLSRTTMKNEVKRK
jgi:hypothetical protein